MNLNLQNRVMGAVLLVTLFSLFISGFVTIRTAVTEMEKSLISRIEGDLTAKKEIIKGEVSSYFDFIRGQLISMSNDISTVEKAEAFISAYSEFPEQASFDSAMAKQSVRDYYARDFTSEFNKTNSNPANIDELLAVASEQTLAMQYAYISSNSNPLGNKDLLTTLGNGSRYDQVHSKYHDSFRTFLRTFEYYDIFIVDAGSGDIVYSVFKELDFATNLVSGPYAKSGIGQAFQRAMQLDKGESYLTDFNAYFPSYNNPASFIATPVFKGNEKIAVLIFQMPIGKLNALLTHSGHWKNAGFGNTGETYVVGEDKTLRTEPRLLVENQDEYFSALFANKVSNAELIQAKETAITLQAFESDSIANGFNGKSGFLVTENYLGLQVFSTYSPLDFGGLRWVLIAELNYEEGLGPVSELVTKVTSYAILITIVLAIASLGIAWGMSKILLRPLAAIGRHVEYLNSGEADLTRRVPDSNLPEINRISSGFNQFIEQIQQLLHLIKREAESVASASTQLSTSIEQTNQTAKMQQKEVKEVTFAIEQFNSAIQAVSESSEQASNNTSKTRKNTQENSAQAKNAESKISELVQEVNSSAKNIEKLKDEVSTINKVLEVINGIADQTNLLALNAAIEAARAGEHGRGFSVVADEVRQLASKTQESTIDIQHKIESLKLVVNETVDSMLRASSYADDGITDVKSVSNSLHSLNNSIGELAEINISVASSAEEQRATCESINQNMIRVAESATELSDVSNEVAESSVELSKIAEEMLNVTQRFKT